MTRVKNQASGLEEALRADGVRITRQRTALLKVLAEADDHSVASELHGHAREIDPTVSLATVYRTSAALEQQWLVHRHAFERKADIHDTRGPQPHEHPGREG